MQKVRNCFKGKLALLLVCALAVGMLPVGTSEANTARSGYGLNNPSTDSKGVTTWDCVWFGNYPQSDTTGETKEQIKWRVLSVNGDDVFLLADQNLDCQKYNDTYTDVTWETCTMRSWLNSTFLNKAFNAAEQAAIKDTTVVNEDNPEYGTEGGNNTTDKIYLLSISEVLNPGYGFVSDYSEYAESRQAKNTEYAKEQGAWTSTSEDYAGNGYWWLRSPGRTSSNASSVDYDGYVIQIGRPVHFDSDVVRPALHLNLSSTPVWSYAGQVTSEGGETPAPTPTASPVQTTSPAGTVPSIQNPVAPSSAPAQDLTEKTGEDETAPGKVTALKLKAKKKALQASWKKVSGASGYEIWCSTSKKFQKKSVKTTKKTKLTIGKRKAKKVYFVKVRAYTVKSGKKVYGAWSKTMKKKIN